MKRAAIILLSIQAALVAGLAIGLRSGRMPLGVPGEWEWLRIHSDLTAWPLLISLIGIGLFAGFVATGYRALGDRPRLRLEAAWLLGLALAGPWVQGVIQEGAPSGYGLSKWIIALHTPGSSGYHTVAREQMGDTRRFLAEYPTWIKQQDALHVGTHPPGLFLMAKGLLSAMESSPRSARVVNDLAPASVAGASRALRESVGLPRADGAALTLTGALTLLACASTVVPLYILARATLPAPLAWASASLWPVVPSALMFQPTADAGFPLLSTTALALAAWARRSGSGWGLLLAMGSGIVMAVGMLFTLAFLPVGLIVGLVLLMPPGPGWKHRAGWFVATGAGFVFAAMAWWAWSSANPFAIWWANQHNHSRFYAEYPRSYLAWVLANPVEVAIGLGLPASVLAVVGFTSPQTASRSSWATVAVLAMLTLSGRSLSEVARLWLPFFPTLLIAAASGLGRVKGGSPTLGASVGLMGIQALILEAAIQVVYPV